MSDNAKLIVGAGDLTANLIGGYKAVDYDAATKDAEHKGHFASGGLVPESMGGHVTPEHMGEGFADGGSAYRYF